NDHALGDGNHTWFHRAPLTEEKHYASTLRSDYHRGRPDRTGAHVHRRGPALSELSVSRFDRPSAMGLVSPHRYDTYDRCRRAGTLASDWPGNGVFGIGVPPP